MNYTSINYAGETVNGTLEWNGRQLVAVNQGNKRYEYSYNSDGLRTSVKTYLNNAPESIQYYIWQNGKLMGYFNEDKIGNDDTSVKMLYDKNGELIGLRLVDEQLNYDKVLFFRKNLQGDILSVYDSFGNQVLTYTYDAWGNVTVTVHDDSTQSTISASMALNYVPITYRGYMYDANTGLYYLQSRYYNPTYGRFLNADTTEILESTQGTPLGANLFAYCNNNPVNMIDPMGNTPLSGVLGGILGGFSLGALMPYLFILGVFVITFIYFLNHALFDELSGGFSLGSTISIFEWSIFIALYKLQQDVSLSALIEDINGRIERYKYRKGQERHHIAPQKVFFTNVSLLCCEYLNKAEIDINSPFNLIYLNASFHSSLNTNIYYSFVYNLTKVCYEGMKQEDDDNNYSAKVGVYSALIGIRLILFVLNWGYMTVNGGVI